MSDSKSMGSVLGSSPEADARTSALPIGQGNSQHLAIAIQVPADAAAQLAQSHPEKILELAAQADKHAFEFASQNAKLRAERQAQSENLFFVASDKKLKDQAEARKTVAALVSKGMATALIALALILAYAAFAHDGRLAEALFEKMLIFLGGTGIGIGADRLWLSRRSPSSERD